MCEDDYEKLIFTPWISFLDLINRKKSIPFVPCKVEFILKVYVYGSVFKYFINTMILDPYNVHVYTMIVLYLIFS